MNRKNIIIGMLLCAMGSSALPVRYSYDAAGNRVKRELVVSSSRSKKTAPNTYYTDDLSADYKVRLHPSSSDGTVRVEIISKLAAPEGSIEVYTASGMKVMTCRIDEGMAVVNLGNHRNGVYILNIDIEGKKTSWKITKR